MKMWSLYEARMLELWPCQEECWIIWELNHDSEQLASYCIYPYDIYCVSTFLNQEHEFWTFECWVWTSRTILKIPEFGVSAWAGKALLEREMLVPRTFADMDARSSGEIHARAGNHVVWLLARASKFTLERKNEATSTFVDLKGPLERPKPRSSGEPCFRKFVKMFCVSFSVLFHF